MRSKNSSLRLCESKRFGDDLIHLLPPELWLQIFEYCHEKDLCNLQQTSSYFGSVIKQESLWIKKLRTAPLAIAPTFDKRFSTKELYGLSKKWLKGKCTLDSPIDFQFRHIIPWIELSSHDYLWTSFANRLCNYKLDEDGSINKPSEVVLCNPAHSNDDFCRFRCLEELIIVGTRNGNLLTWEKQNYSCLESVCAHTSDVHSVDFNQGCVVSGSRDKTAKVWRFHHGRLQLMSTCLVGDRVWSVALAPDSQEFVVGTAALSATTIAPVMIWNTELGICNQLLGSQLKRGAGSLHVLYDNAQQVLSAGYDTYVRLWDLRANTCALSWPEVYDNSVFCLATDHNNVIFAGSSRFGLVWAYDKRFNGPLRKFYASNQNRPVYSLAFTPKALYVALDTHIAQLRF